MPNKIEERFKEDLLKIKENLQEFKEAFQAQDGVIARIKEEAEDFIIAFWLAVIQGEEGREKALSQGGSPEPEKNGFEYGLLCRELMREYGENLLMSAIKSAIIKG